MPKYEVRWQESRMINCYTEIEAESEEEAIKKAQSYEEDVDENEAYTIEIRMAKAQEIEE